jgi:hypothetical protein
MDMRTNLLTSLCGAKDSDNRDFWLILLLRSCHIASELRIKLGGVGLVMIHAVKPNAKEVHDKVSFRRLREHLQMGLTPSESEIW